MDPILFRVHQVCKEYNPRRGTKRQAAASSFGMHERSNALAAQSLQAVCVWLKSLRDDNKCEIERGQFVLDCEALHGNPHDRPLARAIEHVEQTTGLEVKRMFVDRGYRGYRGHGLTGHDKFRVHHDGQKRATEEIRFPSLSVFALQFKVIGWSGGRC